MNKYSLIEASRSIKRNRKRCRRGVAAAFMIGATTAGFTHYYNQYAQLNNKPDLAYGVCHAATTIKKRDGQLIILPRPLLGEFNQCLHEVTKPETVKKMKNRPDIIATSGSGLALLTAFAGVAVPRIRIWQIKRRFPELSAS